MTTDTTPLERADRAVRDAWGDQHHTTSDGGMFFAPPVRDGGATDALIRLAVPTVLSAALDRDELARVICRRIHRSLWPPQPFTGTASTWARRQGCDNCYEHADAVIAHLTGGAS